MTTIKNLTKKPLRVPLPESKRLFLGPGKSGQITPSAVDHPPLAALVAAGELEIVDDGGKSSGRDGDGGSAQAGPANQRQTPKGKSIFRSGDR